MLRATQIGSVPVARQRVVLSGRALPENEDDCPSDGKHG